MSESIEHGVPSLRRNNYDRDSARRFYDRPRTESWMSMPVLTFEPTTPVEIVMVCHRLNMIWVSALHCEAINWNTLEVASAEISRLERALLTLFADAD